MNYSDETLLYQLKTDLIELFTNNNTYSDMFVKTSYDGNYDITYPLIEIKELNNEDVNQFYDGAEHIIDVGYQFTIMAEQTETLSAEENVRNIINIIKEYMRGDRYHALRRIGSSPVLSLNSDSNIMIGYMRYEGRIDIDTNTIYRR